MAACATLLLVGCTPTTALEQDYDSTGIVVGSGTTIADRIVAEIYADALRGAGAAVTTDLSVGDRFDYVSALEHGRVSVVPDDTASLLAFFRRGAQDRHAGSADSADDGDSPQSEMDRAEPEPPAGAAPVGDSAGGADARRVAELSGVLPPYLRIADAGLAERSQILVLDPDAVPGGGAIRALSEIAPQCQHIRASLVAGLVSGGQTASALEDVYGCTFESVELVDTAVDSIAAVRGGGAAVGGATNLSSAGMTGSLETLGDDLDALPSGRLIPLFRAGALTGPEKDALNNVAGELTTAELVDMVERVRKEGASAQDVASQWARSNGL